MEVLLMSDGIDWNSHPGFMEMWVRNEAGELVQWLVKVPFESTPEGMGINTVPPGGIIVEPAAGDTEL
jgi:hypothetical protein